MSNTIFPSLVRGLTWTVVRTPGFSTIEQKSTSAQAVRIAQYQNPVWQWQLMWDYLYANWGGTNNTQAYAPWTDVQTLMGFFMARQGKFDDFLYQEPSDDSVGPGIVTTTWKRLTFYNAGFGILDAANHWQQVSVAGQSGSTIPTFNNSGGTTTDGGVTWQDLGAGYSGGIPNSLAVLQVVSDGAGHYFSPIQRNMGGLFPEDITDLNPLDGSGLAIYANAAAQTIGVDFTLAGPGLAIPGYAFTGLYIAWTAPLPWIANWDMYTIGGTPTGPSILDSNGNVQLCTTSGETGATEPVWNTSMSGTTTDNTVTWTNQGPNPPPAGPVTAAFNFFFRVTFDGDAQDFEQTMQELWTIGGGRSRNGQGYLKLITSRPQAANLYNNGAGARLLYGFGTVQVQWRYNDGSTPNGNLVNVFMDGQGNASLQWVGGSESQACYFGLLTYNLNSPDPDFELIENPQQGSNAGPVNVSGLTVGEELIVVQIETALGDNYWFSGPAARNSDSNIHATLVMIGT